MTLADLQKHLSPMLINPNPPVDLMIGETAFCTYKLPPPGGAKSSYYMWSCLEDKDMDLGQTDVKYKISSGTENLVWVEAKYFWTKEQVLKLVSNDIAYIPCWEDNFVLPVGIEVRDPKATIQALLNLMRDIDVKGRAGGTNLPAVKCNVEGMTLGHFYKLGDALGPDVCNALNEEITKRKKK